MAQNPLPPPPPSGGVLDGWLYLLWRRLTQTGQILWDSITPGTSADVAAVVTDETGSPGSLVFSGNPTFNSLNVASGEKILAGVSAAFDISPSGSGQYPVIGAFSASSSFPYVSGYFGNDSNSANWTALKSRSGTVGTHGIVSSGDQVGGFLFRGDDGTYFRNCASIYALVDGTTASNQMPGRLTFSVSPPGAAATMVEKMRISSDGSITLGGLSTAPAIKVIPVASQARWIEVTGATSSTNPTIGVSGGNLATSAVFMPVQATTAGAPAYVLGGMYYDTTLNKLRIGGATAWETVTSI